MGEKLWGYGELYIDPDTYERSGFIGVETIDGLMYSGDVALEK